MKKALILTPCTGVHQDITELMWSGKTSAASDKLQTLPLMRCLEANDYATKVASYNTKYTFEEIKKIEQPNICFIGKTRHNPGLENGDQFCQFHLTTILNIKRKGAKIVCLYSDHVCDYNDQDAQMYKNFLYLSDAIITPSQKLREHAAKRVTSQTELITIPDPELLQEQPFKALIPGQTCKIIWFGHNKNIGYLNRILPSLIRESDSKTNYTLTILASRPALKEFKNNTFKSLPHSTNWSLRLTPWDVTRQPTQLVEELRDAHISIIPSDPNDPLKNGAGHNRLIDSIQSGCITIASPINSYLELKNACLIGENFSELLKHAIKKNTELCKTYEKIRPLIMNRFDPNLNLKLWGEALKIIEGKS